MAQRFVAGIRPVLGAAVIGLAAAWPLARHGASCGQDFDFHLQSWLAVRAAWHSGLVVPHWVAAANYGAGEPRLLFYPPLSWLLGALLSFVLPLAWVPWAFTVVVVAGLAWSMHRAAGRLVAPTAAWAAAIAYALAPYLLFCAYERGALAELLAGVFMPPLLTGLAANELSVARVALLVAALWYTNAPAAVMGCYLVLLACMVHAVRLRYEHRRRPLTTWAVRAAVALALGCGLAADYLVPAWYDERYVSIASAIQPGMRIVDSFLFHHTGEPYHDQVLHTASSIAVATFVFGALCAAAAWRALDRGSDAPRRLLVLCTTVLCAGAVLQLQPTLWMWNALPQFKFLQFPWRLLLPVSAAAALLLALALGGPLRTRRLALVLTACAGLCLIAWAGITRFQPCDDEDNVAAQLLLPSTGGFAGTDEYAAAGSDDTLIQQGLPKVRLLRAPDADEGDDDHPNADWTAAPRSEVSGELHVQAWAPEHVQVQVRPFAAAYAVLLRARFPAWQVRVNGAPCGHACVPRPDGLLTIAAPAGRWTQIDVQFYTSWRIWTGRLISLLAGLVLLALGRRRRQLRYHEQEC